MYLYSGYQVTYVSILHKVGNYKNADQEREVTTSLSLHPFSVCSLLYLVLLYKAVSTLMKPTTYTMIKDTNSNLNFKLIK